MADAQILMANTKTLNALRRVVAAHSNETPIPGGNRRATPSKPYVGFFMVTDKTTGADYKLQVARGICHIGGEAFLIPTTEVEVDVALMPTDTESRTDSNDFTYTIFKYSYLVLRVNGVDDFEYEVVKEVEDIGGGGVGQVVIAEVAFYKDDPGASEYSVFFRQTHKGDLRVGGGGAHKGSWRLYNRPLEEGDEGYDPETPKSKVAMEWGLIRIGRLQLRYPFEEGAVFPEYIDVDDWTVNQSVWLLLKHDPEEAPNCFMEDSEVIDEEPPDPENFGFEVEMKLYGATAVLQGTNTIYPVLIGIIDSEGAIRQHRREDIDVVGRIV